MTIPTWTPGQVLTASDVNTYFVPKVAIKTVNESVTSSTTLQNDDELFLSLAANATYLIIAYIRFDGSTTGDFKWQWTMPASGTARFGDLHQRVPETDSTAGVTDLLQTDIGAIGCNGAGATLPLFQIGNATTAGTAGNLQLTWAQNTSNATATRVLTSSLLIAFRIS